MTDEPRDTAAGGDAARSVHEGAKTVGSLLALGGLILTAVSVVTGWLFDYAVWFTLALLAGAGLYWGSAVAGKLR